MRVSPSAVLALVLVGAVTGVSLNGDGGLHGDGEACRVTAGPILLEGLRSASGVAASRRTDGLLWSHNDSGKPVIVALDASGSVIGRVQVAGAAVVDWEDIAMGPCPSGSCLYIADIGDNDGVRSSVTIYRVPEPDPHAATTAPAQVFHATYPDRPQDAEAFFVTASGQMFIVTKGESAPIALYRFPTRVRPGATVKLERVGEVQSEARVRKRERITGASVSPDDQWVALRTHNLVRFYRTAELTAGRWLEVDRADVRVLHEPQGEGVAIARDGTVYLVGEGGKHKQPGTFARLACTFKP